MKQNIKETISNVFLEIFAQEVDELPTPELSDDVVLLESGLDSMGFAILVVELEEKLGYDPFTISDEPFYPTTFGEFVNFYEKHQL
jgi:acyl carrier protein|tara:strand:- start:106 stop:363 length:258 start_codon:yes stop_codon:yes gene_type:complete